MISPHVAAAVVDICETIGLAPTSVFTRWIAERIQECVEVELKERDASRDQTE